ncbi:MAG: purine-nucleoside phosphorylase [Bacteroidota bacterium]|nr:purine-nucleoside phosphorylase [Bacteroidota bacterium]
MLKTIAETVSYINSRTNFTPDFGIILGTGLGGLVSEIQTEIVLDYQDIPNFPVSTVESHQGKLIFGHLDGKKVVAMQGRFHYYEGYSMQEVTFPVRVMKQLGIRALFVSNASGGLNPDFNIGDLMILNDHINLLPNPLVGKNHNNLGDRFPDMSEPYDRKMIDLAKGIGQKHGYRIQEGTYVAVSGPSLETPAEYRFLRTIGADAVGMSTVPEVIVARHANLPVFAISIITDLGVPGKIRKVSLNEILAVAEKSEPQMTQLLKELIIAL